MDRYSEEVYDKTRDLLWSRQDYESQERTGVRQVGHREDTHTQLRRELFRCVRVCMCGAATTGRLKARGDR